MAKILTVLFIALLAGCTVAPVRLVQYVPVEVVGKSCGPSGYHCQPVYRPVADTAVVEGVNTAPARTAGSISLPAHTEVWAGPMSIQTQSVIWYGFWVPGPAVYLRQW